MDEKNAIEQMRTVIKRPADPPPPPSGLPITSRLSGSLPIARTLRHKNLRREEVVVTPKPLAKWRHHTSPAHQVLGIAAANGRTDRRESGNGWLYNEQSGLLQFHWEGDEGNGFTVMMKADPKMERIGWGDSEFLNEARLAANADTTIILSYILNLFIPDLDAEPNWKPQVLDLRQIADRVGLDYTGAKESKAQKKTREQVQEDIVLRVWRAIVFGATARVEGSTKRWIKEGRETRHVSVGINAPMLGLFADSMKDKPAALSLFRFSSAPTYVEVGISPVWVEATRGKLRDYLPLGEVIGKIPGKNAKGSYARALALYWFPKWRVFPGKTLNGELRSEKPATVFGCYPPSVAAPSDFIGDSHAHRVLQYYCGALCELRVLGIIKKHPDEELASLKARLMKEGMPPGGLTQSFMGTYATPLYPSDAFKETLINIQNRRPIPSDVAFAKGRGRPRKAS